VTQIAFHFGAPDKIAYACRLLRKATSGGARVLVLADESVAHQLDAELWGVAAVDFVPHCLANASDSVLRHSPVVVSTVAISTPGLNAPVLLQLNKSVPDSVRNYGRVIEVVSLDEDDRLQARQRWKTYAAWGLTIQKHDLALKAQS
jgi:DNA polymerase-3 subunit chi